MQDVSNLPFTITSQSKQGQNYNFYCSICDDKFLFESTWKRHVESHSVENSNGIKCTFCSRYFDCEESLLTHKLREHEDMMRMQKCRFCDQRFDSVKELNLHCSTHYSIGKKEKVTYTCNVCQKLFAKNSDLKAHLSKHEICFSCKCCKREFLEHKFLLSHELLHLNENSTYKCLKCSQSFTSPEEVSFHMIELHSIPDPTNICSVCGKNFDNAQLLDFHLRIHFGKKPYICDRLDCKMVFGFKEQFDSHVRSFHQGEKPFQCLSK